MLAGYLEAQRHWNMPSLKVATSPEQLVEFEESYLYWRMDQKPRLRASFRTIETRSTRRTAINAMKTLIMNGDEHIIYINKMAKTTIKELISFIFSLHFCG